MSIKTRKIFYISGFDPRGPNHYHTLYRDEAEKFAQLTGENINVFNRKHISPIETSWKIERAGVKADYSFLRWDDIIRDNWEQAAWPLFIKSIKMYWHMLRCYDWKTAFKLHHRPLTTIAFPIILTLFLIWAVLKAWDIVDDLWLIIELPLVAFFVWLAVKLYSTMKAPWLLRLFTANDDYVRGKIPALEKRYDEFAGIISSAINDKTYDEVIVIGHSYGGMLLAPIIARLNKKDAGAKHLSIISLGQCIPLTSLYGADHYNKDLEEAASKKTTWFDIGAPADAACWSLIGAYKATPKITDIQNTLINISPRFHTMYEEENYKRLRWNKYAFHFLYLTCPDNVDGGYNYFDLTTGKKSCGDYIGNLK